MGDSNLETEPNLADIESSVHSGDSALLESEGEMKMKDFIRSFHSSANRNHYMF